MCALVDLPTHNSELTDAELLLTGYRFALALTHHAEDAEDLVQESWLNLCRRYGRVESRAVLFTAERNLFIDQCRRKKVVDFESLDEPDARSLLAVVGEEPGLRGDLDELLAVLRPAERAILFLHYHQGHTAEEIAQSTGQPRGTVLSTLRRAIAKLRDASAWRVSSRSCNQWTQFIVAFV